MMCLRQLALPIDPQALRSCKRATTMSTPALSKVGARYVPCVISATVFTLTVNCHHTTVSSFTQIYDTLPPEAQRTLLQSYLVPLLDDSPDSVSTKVINAAKEMQTLFVGIPKLDYNALRTELEQLLNDIERDRKQ